MSESEEQVTRPPAAYARLTDQERWELEQLFDALAAIAARRHKLKVEDVLAVVTDHKERKDTVRTIKIAGYISLLGIVIAASVSGAWEVAKLKLGIK